MKKINVSTKGYTLEFHYEKKDSQEQVAIMIPARSRNDRMTYWTPEELITLVRANFHGLGKNVQGPNDLIHSLDASANVVILKFEVKAKIPQTSVAKDTKISTKTPARTFRKKTKK